MASIELNELGETVFNFEDDLVVGHEVLAAASYQTLSEEERGRVVRLELRSLRLAARQLMTSSDPDQVLARDGINNRFFEDSLSNRKDRPAFTRTKKIVNWLGRAKHDDLYEFCEWSSAEAVKQQKALDDETPYLMGKSRDRLEQLVSLGVFPAAAHEAFDLAFEKCQRLHAIDSFNAGASHVNGYFEINDGEIYLSNQFMSRPDYFWPNREMQGTAFHEWLHASGKFSDAGFLTRSILEEFFVAHVTEVGGGKLAEPDIFNPLERTHSNEGSYQDVRKFMSLVLRYGSKELTAADMAAGFFDTTPRRRAQKHVYGVLDRNISEVVPGFNRGGFHKLSTAFDIAFARPQYDAFMQSLLTGTQERIGTIKEAYKICVPHADPKTTTVAAEQSS